MEGNEVLKETALLYLSDALFKQSYEECAGLVAYSKEFGASSGEIKEVITDYLEGRKPSGLYGANQGTNRLEVFPPKADQPSAEKEG